jgi:hypothetical protein
MLNIHAHIVTGQGTFEYVQATNLLLEPLRRVDSAPKLPAGSVAHRTFFFVSNPNHLPDIIINKLPVGPQKILLNSDALLEVQRITFVFDGVRLWPKPNQFRDYAAIMSRFYPGSPLETRGHMIAKGDKLQPICDLSEDRFWVGAEILSARDAIAS